MTPERWQQIKVLLHDALDVPSQLALGISCGRKSTKRQNEPDARVALLVNNSEYLEPCCYKNVIGPGSESVYFDQNGTEWLVRKLKSSGEENFQSAS